MIGALCIAVELIIYAMLAGAARPLYHATPDVSTDT